ncbi:MAG: hypothetical protein IJU76_00795 [Desulfovibrionaceae bacterium]|nr:hypothetical protein [Desulfovibrionaceae bacterium]
MLGETIEKIIAKDREEARSEWFAIGRREGRQEVARNMLKKGWAIEFISSATKIPMSELEEMQSQLHK